MVDGGVEDRNKIGQKRRKIKISFAYLSTGEIDGDMMYRMLVVA